MAKSSQVTYTWLAKAYDIEYRKMGRPTDYNDSILEKANDYLENYESYEDAIPSVAGLATVLEVARSTVYDWASQEAKKEFSDILQKILAKQERVLINKGLTGDFNSNITKLALGKHGYSEKQDVSATVTEISHEDWLKGLK